MRCYCASRDGMVVEAELELNEAIDDIDRKATPRAARYYIQSLDLGYKR